MMTTTRWITLAAALSLSALPGALACSSSGGSGGSGSGGSAGSGGGGNSACPSVDSSGCSVTLVPGTNDSDTVNAAFINAKSGDTVCFCPGTYSFTKEIRLTSPKVTVKGLGKTRDDVVLDFDKQTDGQDAFGVTGDGFTVENLSLKNSHGNGITVTGADTVTFENIKVSWDAGSKTSNGAYAVYPVQCQHVIVENSEIVGAADAGLYVGQCTDAIVKNNKVHGNVAGIEFENTTNAEAFGNESYDNAAGILAFRLPNLDVKTGKMSNIHDNNIHDNNRKNFAEQGSIVSNVPTGTGVLILANDQTEVHDNQITGNESTGVMVVSYTTLEILLSPQPAPDPQTNPYPHDIYIHDNTFSNNGTDPQSILALWKITPLEDVLWDGVVDPNKPVDLCLGTGTLPSFRNINVSNGGLGDTTKQSTDATPYQCAGTSLPPVSW
jgi:parallel beta-helix repeat protein